MRRSPPLRWSLSASGGRAPPPTTDTRKRACGWMWAMAKLHRLQVPAERGRADSAQALPARHEVGGRWRHLGVAANLIAVLCISHDIVSDLIGVLHEVRSAVTVINTWRPLNPFFSPIQNYAPADAEAVSLILRAIVKTERFDLEVEFLADQQRKQVCECMMDGRRWIMPV